MRLLDQAKLQEHGSESTGYLFVPSYGFGGRGYMSGRMMYEMEATVTSLLIHSSKYKEFVRALELLLSNGKTFELGKYSPSQFPP